MRYGRYSPSYERAESLAWVDDAYGALSIDEREACDQAGGVENMTGYDLCAAIREWLVANSHADLSVCEVILQDLVSRKGVLWEGVLWKGVLWKDVLWKGVLWRVYCGGCTVEGVL